jgi:hypothetical protein
MKSKRCVLFFEATLQKIKHTTNIKKAGRNVVGHANNGSAVFCNREAFSKNTT